MQNKEKMALAAIASFLTLAISPVSYAQAQIMPGENEKCFGVVKKGMNDCKSGTQSSAGSSIEDGQKDAFIWLPKGTCDKIIGASVNPDEINDTSANSVPSLQNNDMNNIPEEERD